MPIMDCTRDGQRGKKWGAMGFCYLGENAGEKARQQGLAVLRSEAKAAGHMSEEAISSYIQRKAGRELSNK